jgi:hypothetical protein
VELSGRAYRSLTIEHMLAQPVAISDVSLSERCRVRDRADLHYLDDILIESSSCDQALSPCVVKAWLIRKDREDFQASHESESGQDGVDETAVNQIMLKLVELLLSFLYAGGRESAESESSHNCVHLLPAAN